MILCDSNVWLALALSKHLHHDASRRWLDTIDEPVTVLFCRATQQSFLRLLTNSAVLGAYGNQPLTNREAWDLYETILADDRIAFRTGEPIGTEALWRELASRDSASPKLWMDAYLAAFSLAGGYKIVTTDLGFRQFQGLDLWVLGQGQTKDR